MPLHLLGKKSWNVYNQDNVARVRRDEAEAKAREEAEEQRQNHADSLRRIALLRGEDPPDSPAPSPSEDVETEVSKRSRDHGFPRKRRRLRGEDDTDRDIRYAREDADAGERAREALRGRVEERDAPLIDHAGHLQLIPAPDEKDVRKAEKDAEVEAEKAKKRKKDEDQFTMRFSNAAGFKNDVASKPWYANTSHAKASSENVDSTPGNQGRALALPHVQDRNVWGNEDPLRKERERNRISINDPFAAMQQAQRQLKQSARDREKWQQERSAELEELKREDDKKRRREKRHHRRSRDEERDSLDGFSLDAVDSRRDGKEQRSYHHRHRRRSRSPHGSRDRDRRSRYH